MSPSVDVTFAAMHHYVYANGALHPLVEPLVIEIISSNINDPDITTTVSKKILKMIEEQSNLMTSQL